MDSQTYLKNVSTLEYDSSLCIGCKMCIEVCPHNVFRMRDKKAEIIDRDRCMECGACEINFRTKCLILWIKNILQDFSEQEREVFLGLLRKLSQNMMMARESGKLF